MIKISFPDGSVREFARGISAHEVAQSISERLAQDVLAASVNGRVVDVRQPITEDATLKLHKWDDEDGKRTFWHTSSHLMAEALQELYPGIKFGIGPSVESGFYYDVDSPTTITETDLPKIEEKMCEIVSRKGTMERRDISKAEALEMFKNDPYKIELINDLEDGTITVYTNGAFPDYHENANRITLRWKIVKNSPEKIAAEITRLQSELAATDYQVIKSYEYTLAKQKQPYDITGLHAERQAIRDRITELEKLLS